jgi:hypothetical protein
VGVKSNGGGQGAWHQGAAERKSEQVKEWRIDGFAGDEAKAIAEWKQFN